MGMARQFSIAMSTLVEIEDAVARLPNRERKALQLWLNSQSEPELTALEEQRLLRSLDDAVHDIDAGKGVSWMRFASGSAHGLQNSLLAPVFDARPQPDLLPQEKEAPLHACLLSADRPANPVAGFSKRRRMILLLLGEKAGMREDVNHLKSEFRGGNGSRRLTHQSLAMTEIKLGRIPHSALSFLRLNGFFPVFILGWTIGANLA